MLMPDFIVLGAPKAGTTSLYFYLKQHPQIFVPEIKEPGFFAFTGTDLNKIEFQSDTYMKRITITEPDKYTSLFENAGADQKKGDFSTVYLGSPQAPLNIARYAPQAKMIAILRNPIERAFSNFMHRKNANTEQYRSFLDAVKAEPERLRQNWYASYHYINAGMYSVHLKAYFDQFPRDQIRIYLYEELAQIDWLIKDLFEFIGVDPAVPIDTSVKFNTTGKIPRIPWLHRILQGDKSFKKGLQNSMAVHKWASIHAFYDKLMLGEPAKMNHHEREVLREIFREDIMLTSSMIGRDLSHWLA